MDSSPQARVFRCELHFMVGLTATGVAIAALALGAAPRLANAQQASGQIAFQRTVGEGETQIYVINADGSGLRRIAEGRRPAWSPDGRQIAYYTSEGVHVVALDGSPPRLLPQDGIRPDWAPDGKRLTFQGDDGIYVVGADGSGLRRVTRADDSRPKWSPRGSDIVFERFLEEDGHTGEAIFVVNVDGGGERRLTDGLGHAEPAWSPNARWIAFLDYEAGRSAGTFDPYVMKADGSDQRAVVETSGWERDLSWSPRGTRLVFATNAPGSRGYDVRTVRLDGKGHRNLTHRPRVDDSPDWSPDGQRIVFTSALDHSLDIYVMSASGRDKVNLTNTPKGTRNESPAWRPGT